MSTIIEILSIYLMAGILLASFIAAYAVTKGNTRLNRIFAILSGLVGVFLFGYLLELNSDSLPQMIFWNQIQYIALPFYPAFWLVLSMTYTDQRPKKSVRLKRGQIFVIPTVTFLIRLTNDWHHLYYRSMSMGHTAGFPVMLLEKGPWYYLNWAYIGVCLIYATRLYLRQKNLPRAMMRGHYLMLASSLMPYLALCLILINPYNSGLDFTAIIMPISLYLVMVALFRYDFLAVQTLARDIVFEKGKDALILIDAQHLIKDSNQRAKLIFPELASNAYGHLIEETLTHRTDLLTRIKQRADQDVPFQIELGDSTYEVQTIRLTGKTGYEAGLLIALSDITDRRRFQEKLKMLASKDGLTGLLNRATFIESAEEAIKLARQMQQPCSLIMIDIDHFKVINDTYGHAAGDLALKTIGGKLKSFFRAGDIVGRIGGEEFAVLLLGASLSHSEKIVDRFRDDLAGMPIIFNGHEILMTVSIGVTERTDQAHELDELLRMADEALYDAKRSGRNCVRFRRPA
jgi:diguanylate cyclase (GGDEF)-like protein